MKPFSFFTSLAAVVAVSGCATGPKRGSVFALNQPIVSRLTPREVIDLARASFAAHGVKVESDIQYVLSFQITPTERLWLAHLGEFVSGHYNWITINDETRKVAFFGPDGPIDPLLYLRMKEEPNQTPEPTAPSGRGSS